ncbi:PKD2L2, partial [Symbiodinium sp. KB8]
MLKSGLAADGKSEGSEEDRKSSGKEGGGFVPANLRSRRATINPMYFAKKLQDWSKRAKSRTYAYELESGMYKIRRDKNIIELLIFFVFLVDLMVIINMIYDTSVANETNMAIEDAFLDEEFPDAIYKKNFYEIKTHEEFWTWLRGPLYNAAYQESWYNDNPYQN